MLNWNTKIKASTETRMDGVQRVILRGVLIDNTVNRNKWQILAEDLPDIAAQSVGTQLRLDHSDEVSKVKGKILSAEVDEPHDFDKADWDPAIDVPHVHFEAEFVTKDSNISIPVLNGYVNHVSIGAKAEHVYCSECGKPTRPVKVCTCNSHDILKDIRVEEYSIITNPAYENAGFMTFTAAVDKHLEQLKEEGDILENEPVKKPDESITITSSTVNIYNADVEPIIKVETKEEPDTKVEIKADTESEKITAEVESEETDVKAEVKPPIVEPVSETPIPGEIQENDNQKTPSDFKINNVTQEIKDPGIKKVMAKEEKPMAEDENKDDKVEASSKVTEPTFNAEDVGALVSAVKELVGMLSQMNAEVDEKPEEEVKANDGNLTEDHDTKSGNPPSVNSITPSPIEPNTESNKAPKTDKLPVTTPAMHASTGKSAGLVAATEKILENEELSMSEIFKFAASRGVKPLEMNY